MPACANQPAQSQFCCNTGGVIDPTLTLDERQIYITQDLRQHHPINPTMRDTHQISLAVTIFLDQLIDERYKTLAHIRETFPAFYVLL